MPRDDDYRREMMGSPMEGALVSPELLEDIRRFDRRHKRMFDAFISNELGRLAPDVDVTEIASESRSDHFVVKATVVVRISRRSLMEFDDVHARYRELPSRNPDYEDWLAHKKKIDASVATIGPMPRPKPAPPEPDDELDVFGPSASNDKKQEK